MKIKKLISVCLAIVISAMNLNIIFADASIGVNKYITVEEGEFNDILCFIIKPYDVIEMDSKIILKLENGVFDQAKIKTDSNGYLTDYVYAALGQENTYDYLKEEYLSMSENFGSEPTVFDYTLRNLMDKYRTSALPYKLRKISETELEVSLFALPVAYSNENLYGYGKPKYKIPLPFTAAGGGNVKISIDSGNTSISNGTYTIAKTSGSGEEYIYSKGSVNGADKYIIVEEGDFNDTLHFNIRPNHDVEMDSKIILKLENGILNETKIKTDSNGYLTDYVYNALGQENTYDYLKDEYLSMSGSFGSEPTVFDYTLKDLMDVYRTAALPYKLRKISETELEVSLFALPETYANENFYGYGKPKYKIPLPFTAAGGGNVKISIDSDNTSISNGTYTIAKSAGSDEEYNYTDGSVNTVNRIAAIKEGDFNDETYLKIQPNYEVKMGDTVTVTLLNGKFNEDDMNAK